MVQRPAWLFSCLLLLYSRFMKLVVTFMKGCPAGSVAFEIPDNPPMTAGGVMQYAEQHAKEWVLSQVDYLVSVE